MVSSLGVSSHVPSTSETSWESKSSNSVCDESCEVMGFNHVLTPIYHCLLLAYLHGINSRKISCFHARYCKRTYIHTLGDAYMHPLLCFFLLRIVLLWEWLKSSSTHEDEIQWNEMVIHCIAFLRKHGILHSVAVFGGVCAGGGDLYSMGGRVRYGACGR